MELKLIKTDTGYITAKKRDNLYNIRDQYGTKMAILNLQAFKLFIQGFVILFNSRAVEYNFSNISADLKATNEQITDFILL